MNEDPLDRISWPLRTDRLIVRRVRDDDVEHTWRYRRLPEVGEYIGWWTQTFDEYRERTLTDDRRRIMLTIERTDDGAIIGDVMVKIQDAWAQHGAEDQARGAQAEVGWTLDPEYGGIGYATEAVRVVVDACFTQLRLHRVYAGCFAANEPSWRLMERIGMRREQHGRKDGLHRSGEWMDGMEYAVLREEWGRVR